MKKIINWIKEKMWYLKMWFIKDVMIHLYLAIMVPYYHCKTILEKKKTERRVKRLKTEILTCNNDGDKVQCELELLMCEDDLKRYNKYLSKKL